MRMNRFAGGIQPDFAGTDGAVYVFGHSDSLVYLFISGQKIRFAAIGFLPVKCPILSANAPVPRTGVF